MKYVLCLFLASPLVFGKPSYLLIENEVDKALGFKSQSTIKREILNEKYSSLKVEEKFVEHLSHAVHETFHKCGGFFQFETEAELKEFVSDIKENQKKAPKDFWLFKKIDTQTVNPDVSRAVEEVEETNIRSTIEKLSSYKTRYYTHDSGVESAKWIASKWQELTKGRDDAEVSLYNHKNWPQPSVVLKIAGQSNEALVLGGHLDSITRGISAPGADDNASGIATLTEIIRVITEQGYRPQKTLFFMGYAAEEVGLRGSSEIARKMVKEGEYDFKAAIQFDMTNFKGSRKAMYLINDYTSKNFTQYLGTLIDRYVKVEWGYTECGYPCSDHASWDAQGVPAAFPFEADFNQYNRKIHTPYDTIEQSGGTAGHAVNFAKLGVAAVLDFSNI